MWGAQGWNQWALQPAMFNDVPHEQIDWAALAKQWIQMQQTQPPDPTVPLLPPVPTPTPSTTALPIIHPPPPGHGPVVPEDFSADTPVTAPLLKTPVAPGGLPEPFQTDRPFETDPAGFVQKPVNNAYWNKSQWEASATSDIDERMWPTPSIEPTSSLIAGKETYDYGHMHDNPPLAMQSIDYNHMSEFSYNQVYPSESQYDQYWSQVNAAPPISPMFLKKERTSASTTSSSLPVDEDASQLDAAKRKQLPAWIREGLEKMEQERIKKLEKEKSEKEKAENLVLAKLKKDLGLIEDDAPPAPVKSKFDSDSEAEAEEVNESTPKQNVVTKRSPSPVEDIRTEEEKRQEYMLNIRRVLTEVLLTVTNAELYAIAEEVLRKEQQKARQLASSASLTSVASGLRSLANYGSGSEASDAEEVKEESDSDEELYRRIREKKKLFAIKEKKIIAELERKELEEQNEALKAKNEISSVQNEPVPENSVKELGPSVIPTEEIKPVAFIPPSDAVDQIGVMPFIEANSNDNLAESINNVANEELEKPHSKDSQSSDSSSSSSESENESGERHKKSDKNEHDRSKESDRSKEVKKDKSPKKHHKRRSSDSDSSDRLRKSSRSYDKTSKKSSSYKKKKKYRRSESSSSSGSSSKRRKYSSKSESSHNHSRERRSRSYEDRDRRHRRSISPKSYRSSRDSHRSRDSYSHRHEKDKYLKRDKDKYSYDYKRSPSPHRRSSKLPKKYRSSRSPSSESEHSGKKKKYRHR